MEVEKMTNAERRELKLVLGKLLGAGLAVAINNGGGANEVNATTDPKRLWAGLGLCDEEQLLVYRDGTFIGSVLLVYGLGEGELLADYAMNLEPYLK